jgi:hypothetical protein
MSRIHSFALSERWSSAANTDAFCDEAIENVHLACIAEGLSEKPGLGSASGIAVSSLIDAVKGMKGSPAATLISAVHGSEDRIRRKNEKKAGGFRDATHLSAAIIDDNLDCTILDTGEGNVLVISPAGVLIPRDFPKSSPMDPGPFPPSTGKKPSGQMFSIHSASRTSCNAPILFSCLSGISFFSSALPDCTHSYRRSGLRKLSAKTGRMWRPPAKS